MKKEDNIFAIDHIVPGSSEFLETLVKGKVTIERIVSHGQPTPDGEWYNQDNDEWVVLLQGTAQLAFADGTEKEMNAGDYLLLPAHQLHRVNYTSNAPPCIWLAVHGDFF